MIILLVEDDRATMETLKIFLCEHTRHRCITSDTVDKTLRLLDGIKPDLVLLDYILGNEDAEPIILKLRDKTRYPNVKVVLMTASQDIEKISNKYHLTHPLKKPFDFESLERAIN